MSEEPTGKSRRIQLTVEAIDETGAPPALADEAKREAALGAANAAESIDEHADLGVRLGTIARQIRLAGEWPVYFAAVLAHWLANQPETAAHGVREAAGLLLGLRFERELLADVAEAYGRLPALPDPVRTRLQKQAYERGYHNEKIYRGCAQCTLAATGDVTGRFDAAVFRAASGLAGGMAGEGDGVCGGYSGGALSLGLFAGRRFEYFDGDQDEKTRAANLTAALRRKFIDAYGTVICREIHKEIFGRSFTISDPADKDAFEEAGAHSLDKCPAVVGAAAAWTVGVLYDEGLLEEGGL